MASALEHFVNTVTSLSAQGNYNELVKYISKSIEVLSKNVPLLDNVLATLQPSSHTLGVLAVLKVRLQNTSHTDSNIDTLHATVAEFINVSNEEQIRYAPYMVGELCASYADLLVSGRCAMRGLEVLSIAIQKLRESPFHLTSVHCHLAHLCLVSKCFKPAIKFLDVDLMDICKEMAQNAKSVWFEDQVLMVGDSRVKRLQNHPDNALSVNVSYESRGGALIDEVVDMVDRALLHDHTTVIIMGLIGDEVAQFCHSTSDTSFANLIKFRDAKSVSVTLTKIQEATFKWQTLRADRTILWTTPYYVDFVAHNQRVLKTDYNEEIHQISLHSSKCFVEYVETLTTRWRSSMPTIYFTNLNDLLFQGRIGQRLYKTFAFLPVHYKFPFYTLEDGLHQSLGLTAKMWTFLEVAVVREFKRTHNIAKEDGHISIPTCKGIGCVGGGSRGKAYEAIKCKQFVARPKPYSRNWNIPLSQRVKDNRWNSFTQNNVVHYGNLSWHAAGSNPVQSPAPPRALEVTTTGWSHSQHEASMLSFKSKLDTRALQAEMEDELNFARAVRGRAAAAALAGEIPSVNQVAAVWGHSKMLSLDNPDPRVPSRYPDLSGLVISSPQNYRSTQ